MVQSLASYYNIVKSWFFGWSISRCTAKSTNTVHNTVLSQASAHGGSQLSNKKNRGWAVARIRCLNGSTFPMQAPTPHVKLAARGYQYYMGKTKIILYHTCSIQCTCIYNIIACSVAKKSIQCKVIKGLL